MWATFLVLSRTPPASMSPSGSCATHVDEAFVDQDPAGAAHLILGEVEVKTAVPRAWLLLRNRSRCLSPKPPSAAIEQNPTVSLTFHHWSGGTRSAAPYISQKNPGYALGQLRGSTTASRLAKVMSSDSDFDVDGRRIQGRRTSPPRCCTEGLAAMMSLTQSRRPPTWMTCGQSCHPYRPSPSMATNSPARSSPVGFADLLLAGQRNSRHGTGRHSPRGRQHRSG